jgi:hypothetical protein
MTGAPKTYRSSLQQLSLVGIGLLVSGVMLVFLLTTPLDFGTGLIAAVGLMFGWFSISRCGGARVTVHGDTIEVKNPIRTRRVSRGEIRGFVFSDLGASRLELRSGGSVYLFALQPANSKALSRLRGEPERTAIAELNEWLRVDAD